MKTLGVILACGRRGWTISLAAIGACVCIVAVSRFWPVSHGLAQDDRPDPARNTENVPIAWITSVIDSTPANQLRNPTKSSNEAQRFDSAETGADWSAGHSIVLVHGSMTGVRLRAVDGAWVPQANAKWKVIRNPNDSPALQQPPYHGNLTVNPASGAETALSLDKFGSFSVVAYIDVNGNGDYDQGEFARFYNIVVCQVMFVLDKSMPFRDAVRTEFLTEFQLHVDSQPHDPCEGFQLSFGRSDGDPEHVGVSLDTEIAVAGGGPNGHIGLDRVFCGWTNVCSRWDASGTYTGNHSAVTFIPDVDVPSLPPNYITAAALPNQEFPALNPALSAAKPLVDSQNEHEWTAGDCICMYPGGEIEVAKEFGHIRHVWATDNPNLVDASPHPKYPTKHLASYDGALDFTARLVVWTQARTRLEAGSTLYVCVYEVPWICRGTYNQFDWSATPHRCVEVARNIAFGTKTKHEPPVRLESVQGEVMPPELNFRINLVDAHQ